MKTKQPVRGFLCRSDASTAVCIPRDPRSLVIVPRTTSSTTKPGYTPLLDHSSRKSSRLAESRRFSTATAPGDLASAGGSRQKKPGVVSTAPASASAKRERRSSSTASTAAIPSTKQQHKPLEVDPSTTSLPSTTTGGDVFQVVIMRVSLHCHGCAGKLKKHIYKMEGVTSFTIDLEAKRVTVMGHISPSTVLESISKVKRAEFWYS